LRVSAIFAMTVFCGACTTSLRHLEVSSPSGSVCFHMSFDQPRPKYWVTRGQTTVIEASDLVLTLDGRDLMLNYNAYRETNQKEYRIDRRNPCRGPHSESIERSNGAALHLSFADSWPFYTMEVRAFDDGVAFRFIIPRGGVPD